MSTSGPSSGPCNSFFRVIYFSIILFLFPYFTAKLFCIHLLICPLVFCADLLVKFSFVILEHSVLFVLLEPVSFNSPFFRQYLLIYLFHLYFQTCLLFCFGLFIPTYILVRFSFLYTFACCCSFFLSVLLV